MNSYEVTVYQISEFELPTKIYYKVNKSKIVFEQAQARQCSVHEEDCIPN